MSNIFIINGGVKAQGKGGELNASLTEMAKDILEQCGHSVTIISLNEKQVLMKTGNFKLK